MPGVAVGTGPLGVPGAFGTLAEGVELVVPPEHATSAADAIAKAMAEFRIIEALQGSFGNRRDGYSGGGLQRLPFTRHVAMP